MWSSWSHCNFLCYCNCLLDCHQSSYRLLFSSPPPSIWLIVLLSSSFYFVGYFFFLFFFLLQISFNLALFTLFGFSTFNTLFLPNLINNWFRTDEYVYTIPIKLLFVLNLGTVLYHKTKAKSGGTDEITVPLIHLGVV